MRALLGLAALAVALAYAAPAAARLSQAELDAAAATPRPGAALSLDERLTRADGGVEALRQAFDAPAEIVIFVDYRCRDLCSPIVALASRALAESRLRPGVDYRLVLIGFNPRADAADARRILESEKVDPAARAYLGPAEVTARLAGEAGFRPVYDAERGRFAHPVTLFVTGRSGRIVRVLPALAASAQNLRLALVEAAAGAIGGVSDSVQLHCYGFDAETGFYADRVRLLLWSACAVSLLIGAAGLRRLAKGRAS